MQIREIVLYNARGDVRRLILHLGAVNIITGGSKTGKSALQDIVEYCLGRDSCGVPEGVIWNTVSWYGLLLQFDGSQVFVARKHPDQGFKSSAQVYIELGQQLEPPQFSALHGNTSPQELMQQLTRLLGGSPNLHVPPEGQTRASIEAGIKHALLLVFQGQSEIANRKFLFHRQGEQFIPQAIKDTLPYFLGGVPEDALARQAELHRLDREHRLAIRQLEEAESVAGQGHERAFSLAREAESAGLLSPQTSEADPQRVIEQLKGLVSWTPQATSSDNLGETAARLSDDLDALNDQYREVRAQVSAARSLAGDLRGYGDEVGAQRARLEPIGLFPDDQDRTTRCPVCENVLSEPPPLVVDLQQSLARLDSQLRTVETDRPRLQGAIDSLEERLLQLRREIVERRRSLEAINEQDNRFRELREIDVRRSHVIGRVSLYLESTRDPDNTELEGLRTRVADIKRRIDVLESYLAEMNVEDRISSIVSLIGKRMTDLAGRLEMEYRALPFRLDLKHLTVIADSTDGPIGMERMGSAENWLGCHLISHLALHEFLTKGNRPVPRFLFLDQPTQVYYPPDQDAGGAIEGLPNEDQEAVRRIYDLLFYFIGQLAPRFQIVVTDHADLSDQRFQEAVVERWRGERKLVPVDWTPR